MPAKKAAARRARRFYEQALLEAERADFHAALGVEGIEAEIALLRLRLRTVLVDHQGDLTLSCAASNSSAGLWRAVTGLATTTSKR